MDAAALERLALDPRRATSDEGVVCLLCGLVVKHMTNTHLRRHGLTSEEYKLRFGYNGGSPLMGRDVRRVHTENAVRSGLASRIRNRPIVTDVAVRWRGGSPARRLEALLGRRESLLSVTLPPRDGSGRFRRAGV